MSVPSIPPRWRGPTLTLALAALAMPLHAQTADVDIDALMQRLQALERRLGTTPATDAANVIAIDQRLRVLERRLELHNEEATAKAATASTLSASAAQGVSLKSAPSDGIALRFKGLVQADARHFLDNAANDSFLFRRVRPTIEGSWGPLLGFRLTPEFAGDSATLVDAWLDLKFDPRATVRIGKVKGPIGLERLQSGASLALVERAFPTELAPNRDLGVQLQGDLLHNTLGYVFGVYNGAVDGRDAATSNPDDRFDYAARVFWEPFKNDVSAWSGLGVGLAASVGDTSGSGSAFLPRYRTPGQQQFFGYSDDVAADGLRRRWSPQGYYYRGAFGLLAEYIVSSQTLRVTDGESAGSRRTIDNDAWEVTASYVLTGEDASFRGVARPDQAFTSDGAGWGAFELVARHGELDIDDAAFPLFADPATASSRARAWALGLNWTLTGNLKLATNYTHTRFDGGGGNGDRPTEQAVFSRAQLSF